MHIRITILMLAMMSFISFLPNIASSSPTKYYLSSTGNDQNPGTITKPWKTFKKIDNYKFSPGDTVFFHCNSTFKGGFTISASGEEENPIVFTSYGNGVTPIFRNPKYDDLNGNAIRIKGDFIVVNGLYFYDCPKSPIVQDVRTLGAIFVTLGADHNVIKNCEMTKTPVGIQIYGEHNLITKNYIHDNHVPIRPHWGPMCIIVCTSNNEISYNRFENYCAPSNEYGHDGGAIEVNDGRYDKFNLSFHHNYSSGNQGFLENIQSDCKSRDWLIAYNVCDDYQSWLGLTNVQNIRVENNTVLRIKRHEGYNDFFWFNEDYQANKVYLRNNIFVIGDGVAPVYYQGDGTIQHHNHNLYYCIDRKTFENGQTFNILGTPLGKGEIIANPLFVDFENRNLHLQRGSPAIDAGVNLRHKTDFDGNPVPIGKKPDMGAFEFVGD